MDKTSKTKLKKTSPELKELVQAQDSTNSLFDRVTKHDIYAISILFIQVYMYFAMLDFSRYIVGRVLYNWSILNFAIAISFAVQFYLFFLNLANVLQIYRAKSTEEKSKYVSSSLSIIALFLVINLMAEIVILIVR